MTTEQFLYSALSGIASSFVFLFLVLFLFKPKIRIAPFICKDRHMVNDNTEYYMFKLVNISLFSAYDIKMELLELDRYPAGNGQMHDRYKPIPLVLNTISHIPGYRPSWIRKNAPYAIRIRTTHGLNEILTDDYKSIILKVSLRHGLTGLVKVHSKEYADLTVIKNGKFGYGRKFGSIK